MLFGIRYINPSKNIDNQTKSVFKENTPGYEYTIFDTIGDELDKYSIILSSGKSYNLNKETTALSMDVEVFYFHIQETKILHLKWIILKSITLQSYIL